MACLALADSASCLHCNSAWSRAEQRSGDMIEGLVGCAACAELFHPHALINKCFGHWQTTSFLKLGRETPAVSGTVHMDEGVFAFDLYRAKQLCWHSATLWALPWEAEAAHASVSQHISLLTPPHIRQYLAHTVPKLQRHSHGRGGLKEHTHTHWQIYLLTFDLGLAATCSSDRFYKTHEVEEKITKGQRVMTAFGLDIWHWRNSQRTFSDLTQILRKRQWEWFYQLCTSSSLNVFYIIIFKCHSDRPAWLFENCINAKLTTITYSV